jgi:hypothetical protein
MISGPVTLILIGSSVVVDDLRYFIASREEKKKEREVQSECTVSNLIYPEMFLILWFVCCSTVL